MNYQSIQDAKEGWKTTIAGDGGACPCCERFGKVYSRLINKTMALALKWLFEENIRLGVREWIDVPNTAPPHVLRGYQMTTLRWWGLVERKPVDPTEHKGKKNSGLWRITLKGADFVEGKVKVQAKAHHYNGDVTELVGPEVDFESCLTKRFSIRDTMQEQAGGSGNLFGAVH